MKTIFTCINLLFLLIATSNGQNSKNAIQVIPEGWSAEHFVSNNDRLTYRINFQNTGNDTATDIHIHDQLNLTFFDVTTLVILSSSHTFNFWIESSSTLHWDLLQINLPDSSKNSKDSEGFVEFSIKTKPGLPTGTIVRNSATIFFDSRPSIVTPEVFNTICETGYPALVINPINNFCEGGTGEFVAHYTVPGNEPVFNWYVNNVLMAEGDSVSLAGLMNNDVVQCIFTSSYLCALPATIPSTPFVNTFLAQPVIVQSGSQLISTHSETYQWYFNEQPIPGQTSQVYSPVAEGNYQVEIFDQNGCSSISEIYLYLNSGVDDLHSAMNIFPNPANEQLVFKGLKENSVISIHDLSGKEVKTLSVTNDADQNYQTDINDLLSGVYFVKNTTDKTAVSKIVVLH